MGVSVGIAAVMSVGIAIGKAEGIAVGLAERNSRFDSCNIGPNHVARFLRNFTAFQFVLPFRFPQNRTQACCAISPQFHSVPIWVVVSIRTKSNPTMWRHFSAISQRSNLGRRFDSHKIEPKPRGAISPQVHSVPICVAVSIRTKPNPTMWLGCSAISQRSNLCCRFDSHKIEANHVARTLRNFTAFQFGSPFRFAQNRGQP